MRNRAVKILMIDDNPDNVVVLKALINEAFPEAIVLSELEGQKGLDIAAKEEPDVILLDIIMPGMDGYEVCRRLKADKVLCDIPVVFLTAVMSNKESRIKALECGAEAFLSKPVDETELTAQIRVMLKVRNSNIQKYNERKRLAVLVKNKTRELEKANKKKLNLLEVLWIENEARKEKQSELEKSEAKYRQIAENISDVVWTADLDMKTTYISASVEKIFGESPKAHEGKSFAELFTPNSRKTIHDVMIEELEKEKDPKSDKNRTRLIEVERYRADGNVVWISMHVSFLRDENGKVIGYQGVSRDITERKQMEDQLEQNLKDLLESQRIAHIGTWRLDLATDQVVWSEELYNMFGFDPTYPPPPYTEQRKLFTPESWDTLSAAIEHTRTFGIPYEVELKTVTKDGSNSWMWARGEAETDSDGNIVAIWGAAQDITEHKKIEYEVKQNEERFQLLFDKAPLGYQSLDSEGRFIEVNQKWLDTLGYRKEEVIGKWFGDFLCPGYVDGFRQRFPIFKSQGYIRSEFEMLRKDGQRLHIAFEGKIGYDSDGAFRQTHCILQDITNQKKAEKALIESEERYKYLFEHSGVGIGYYTTDGVVISFNQRALENLGGKLEDYAGKSVSELFPKEAADIYFARIEKAISSNTPQEYEDYLVLASGPKWFSTIITRITNIAGEDIGVQIASLDITKRKLAEEALSESQAILQAAFENSQAGIAIADAPDGKLRYVNKAGLLIRDSTDEEIVKNIDIHNYVESWRILHFDGTPFAEDEVPLARAILYGETCSKEFVIRRDDFEDRYVLANASPIRDSNHVVKAGVVVFIDITEKRQAEEKLRQQNELFASLLKLLPVGVFMVDAVEGKPLVVNDMGATLLGSGVLPDANKHNLSEVYKAYKKDTKQHYPTDEMPILLGMKGISAHIDDMVIERPDGTEILLEVFGTPVLDMQGKPWASLVTFMDITERKKAENELIFLSYHDHLTGFYNRRYFEKALKDFDIPANLPLSIIICDINGLKLINDSFGHEYGDQLLVKAAEAIQGACRADDIVSRIGGDEFAVLLPKTDAKETALVAGTIKSLASEEVIENVELSIAYGYDTKAAEKQDIIEVLSNAENHMYRHKLYERSSMRSKTIDVIMNTLFEKSSVESMHSSRVSSICMAIATEMNFDKADVNKMGIAGLVHDIGKIGIDEKILNKPGRLSEEEREQIIRHPEVGWRILSSANEFSELAQFILDHHEKWDGSGYPNGIKGDEIPLEARIINIADSYDAMTSDRIYRKGMSEDEAIKELQRCAGTQFDPKIVDVFVSCVLQSDNIGGREGLIL